MRTRRGLPPMGSVELRPLTTVQDYLMMEELQLAVWGPHTPAPMHVTYIAVDTGGVAIGAFDGQQMVGFCYGVPAWDGEQCWLHSHMLATLPACRRGGLGTRLKWEQRRAALARNYRLMTWTYDPLEAANAYLNLAKLGGRVRRYRPDYYGEMEDSLNRGLPSDRMWLEWELASPRVQRLARGEAAPVLVDASPEAMPAAIPTRSRGAWAEPLSPDLGLTGAPALQVATPWAFQQLKQERPALARRWRQATAAVFQHYFAAGYVAVDYQPPAGRAAGALGHYLLTKEN